MAGSGMSHVCKILYQRAILLGSCRVVIDFAQEYEAAQVYRESERRHRRKSGREARR